MDRQVSDAEDDCKTCPSPHCAGAHHVSELSGLIAAAVAAAIRCRAWISNTADGVAITVVTVRSPLTSHFQIIGNFSLPQAHAIANHLNR
jgi:hypothetical protein